MDDLANLRPNLFNIYLVCKKVYIVISWSVKTS